MWAQDTDQTIPFQMCKALKSMGDAIILITILAENHAKNYSTIFKRTLQKNKSKSTARKIFKFSSTIAVI